MDNCIPEVEEDTLIVDGNMRYLSEPDPMKEYRFPCKEEVRWWYEDHVGIVWSCEELLNVQMHDVAVIIMGASMPFCQFPSTKQVKSVALRLVFYALGVASPEF